MKRRTFLAASALSIAGTSGCLGSLGGSGSGGTTTDDSASGDDYPMPADGNLDGYPPESDDPPTERDIDTSSFGTVEQDGQQVRLAPLDVVHYWYQRGEARIADARGPSQYEKSHVYGAVLSPVDGRGVSKDPVTDWPKDDRIVCYCGCPHHLSSMRASTLMSNGYSNVFVIDEGFWEWHDKSYPMSGSEVESKPKSWEISGVASPDAAGQSAWAWHPGSGQREATEIAADGSYTLHLTFHDITPQSLIGLRTPDYELREPLAELVADTVTGT